MHKKRICVAVVAFVFALLLVCCFECGIKAKTVTSPDFNVTVGGDEYAYTVLQDAEHDGELKQQAHFRVNLNKEKIENNNPEYNFVWTHKFELYKDGVKLWEEIDIMPKKTGDTYPEGTIFYTKNSDDEVFFSKQDYLYIGYDIDVTANYTVKFYNSFSCVNCPSTYEYKEQVLEPIELKVMFDSALPSVDLSGFNSIIRIVDNNRVIDNESVFQIAFNDDKSGIKDAYFLLSDKTYHSGNTVYVGDLIKDERLQSIESNKDIKLELSSSSYRDAILATTCVDFFFGYYECIKAYYAYFVITDNSENVYVNVYAFGLEVNKDKDDIEYTGEISEEGQYKSISVNINPTYDTYYSLTEADFIETKNITSKYTTPLTIGGSENGEYYLHLIQYKDNGDILKMTRKYTFDNTAPSVDATTSSIPVENTSYKKVSIGVNFKDVYKIESQEYAGSGIDKSYYLISDTLLELGNYATINNSYILGSKVNVDNVVDGTYYVYFRIIDVLGNEGVYYYTYIIDNTAPLVNIIEYSDTDKNIVDAYVTFNVTGANTAVFRCGWFEDGVTPTYSQLTKICNPSTKNYVSDSLEGNYRLWVYASDKAGNEVYEKSPIVLVDRKGPVVTVTNQYNNTEYRYSNQISVNVVDGASNVDSSIYYGWSKVGSTSAVVMNQVVENGVINYPIGYYGTYNLHIKASDVLGNESTTKVDFVYYIDTDSIVLTVYGNDSITIIKNSKYNEEGATAYKSSNKNIKVDVVVEGKVDTSKAGKYVIKYIAGEGELQQIKTRTIIVKEVNQYYYITIGTFGIGIVTSLIIRFIRNKRKEV